MITQDYYLIVFDSTHAAMSAEAFFKNMNVHVKLIPLPSIISVGCGFAIKVLPKGLAAVEACLRQSPFEWSGLYKLVKVGAETHVEYWEVFQ